jgi:hypothetical protein
MEEIIPFILISTVFFMTGIIWIVQISVYPGLGWIESEGFAERHDSYRNRIAAVVTLPMFLELGASIYVVVFPLEWMGRGLATGLLLMLLAIWASTLLLQVPLHERLSVRKDAEAIDGLVRTNWIRTVLWSLRTIVLSVLFLT